MNRYRVRFTPEAEADLLRLFEFLLEKDLSLAERAGAAISKAVELLELFPITCRKAAGGSGGTFLRELIIPFGDAGMSLCLKSRTHGRSRSWLCAINGKRTTTDFGWLNSFSFVRRLPSDLWCILICMSRRAGSVQT